MFVRATATLASADALDDICAQTPVQKHAVSPTTSLGTRGAPALARVR